MCVWEGEWGGECCMSIGANDEQPQGTKGELWWHRKDWVLCVWRRNGCVV